MNTQGKIVKNKLDLLYQFCKLELHILESR